MNQVTKNDKPKSLYGLPAEVKFCKSCLMSNQRPSMTSEHNNKEVQKKSGIGFIDNICDACRYKDKKKSIIDWEEREAQLVALLNKYRSRNGSYDVVIPGSGGKDSFYVAHMLKYKYNMHPITCTFAPNIYTSWGHHNFTNWINTGFPNYLFTSNGLVHNLVTRLAIDKILHPFQPWILGQKNFPVRFAKNLNIPLIFYGEDPVEYGNPDGESGALMNEKFFSQEDGKEIYIAGQPKEKLVKDLKLAESDFDPYVPIYKKELDDHEIKMAIFSYFKPWHPQENYYYTMENSSDFIVSPERTLGTYTKYSSIDDKIDDLHYYTLFIKFGIGRVFYDVAQEIRSGDITVEEGRSLIKQYNGEYPSRFMEDYCKYLSVDFNMIPGAKHFIKEPKFTKDYFDSVCDSYRSPHLWKKENNNWVLRNPIK